MVRILGDDRSAEMVVREAFLRAWETIPQKQPRNLRAYLLRITRNLAVDHSPRDGEYDRVLQELADVFPVRPKAWIPRVMRKRYAGQLTNF